MDSTKCPVCGKTGIPDYLNENVICPNCHSDLGIYRSLHSNAENHDKYINKASRYKKLSIVLPILAGLLIGVLAFVYTSSNNKDYNQKLADADAVIEDLRDSINILCAQNTTQVPDNCFPDSHFFEYTILPNDSPWRIVNKFYGNEKDWKNISKSLAERNNIWDDNTATWKRIYPGQIIRIYNFK